MTLDASNAARHARHRARPRAFTLVEILIVVVILAILAAIVIPQFTSATSETRENALRMCLHRMRAQLEIYQQQHGGDWPTLAKFTDQLTLASNGNGVTAAVGTGGYRFGPYMRQIPLNPFTTKSAVGNGAVGSSDWYYDAATGDFRANDSTKHRTY